MALDLHVAAHATVTGGADALGRVVRNLSDTPSRSRLYRLTFGMRARRLGARGRRRPGFTAEFRECAFESFARADEARSRLTGGVELGLAIAEGLVEGHGTQFWIEAGPGERVAFAHPASHDPVG